MRDISDLHLTPQAETLAPANASCFENIPEHLRIQDIYSRLDLRSLAAVNMTSKRMRLRQPDPQATQGVWNAAVRAALPSYKPLPDSEAFGRLKDAYEAEQALRANLKSGQISQTFEIGLWGGNNECTGGPVASSDGHSIAIPDQSGGVHLLSTITGFTRHIEHHPDQHDPVIALHWFSENRSLAVAHGSGRLGWVDMTTLALHPFATANLNIPFNTTAAFSPTMRYLARCPSDVLGARLQIISLDLAASTSELAYAYPGEHNINLLQWSARGNYLVAADERVHDPSLWVIDAKTGVVITRHQHENSIWAVDFSPDERLVSSVCSTDRAMWTFTLSEKAESSFKLVEEHYEWPGKPYNNWALVNTQLAYEPHGDLIALRVGTGSHALGGVAIYDTKKKTCIFSKQACTKNIAWAPGGRWLAANSQRELHLLDTQQPEDSVSISMHLSDIHWTADGNHLFGFVNNYRGSGVAFKSLFMGKRIDGDTVMLAVDKDLQEAMRQSQLGDMLWNHGNYWIVEEAPGLPHTVCLPNGATLAPQPDGSGQVQLRMPDGRLFLKETLEATPIECTMQAVKGK